MSVRAGQLVREQFRAYWPERGKYIMANDKTVRISPENEGQGSSLCGPSFGGWGWLTENQQAYLPHLINISILPSPSPPRRWWPLDDVIASTEGVIVVCGFDIDSSPTIYDQSSYVAMTSLVSIVVFCSCCTARSARRRHYLHVTASACATCRRP